MLCIGERLDWVRSESFVRVVNKGLRSEADGELGTGELDREVA